MIRRECQKRAAKTRHVRIELPNCSQDQELKENLNNRRTTTNEEGLRPTRLSALCQSTGLPFLKTWRTWEVPR
jgi:hypothetical protein